MFKVGNQVVIKREYKNENLKLESTNIGIIILYDENILHTPYLIDFYPWNAGHQGSYYAIGGKRSTNSCWWVNGNNLELINKKSIKEYI